MRTLVRMGEPSGRMSGGGRSAGAVAVALPRPLALPQELIWPLLLALATAAAIVPFWSSELLPYQDAPQHIAAVRVLADYHAPGLAFDRWFQPDLGRLEYLGFYLPAALIARVSSAEAAVRVVLSLVAVAWVAAFWMFLGAMGRDRRLAVFAPVVFHTAPLYLGFFNFVESVPLAVALVALTERELRNPTWRRAAVLAPGAAVLLWLHPSALAFALAAAAVLALTSGRTPRQMARALAAYLPSLLLLAAWAMRALAERDGPGAQARTPPHWLGLKLQVLDLLRFGNVLAGTWDEVFVLGLAALFAAAVAVPGRPRLQRGYRLPLLALLTLAAYMVAPFDMGYMGYIHLRALPFLMLLIIASPSIAPGRVTGFILGAAAALTVAYSLELSACYRAFDREAQVGELSQVLRAAQPGKRLIAIIEATQSRVMQFQAYLHFAAYYEVQRGGRARYNFAETPWTPVRFRKGTEPVPLPRSWELKPRKLDLPYATSDEDYVLVRAPGPEPDGFDLVSHAGRWSLYAPTARR
ncbi:MAG TPA: hypothetical protein VFL36_08170 [Myxococcales bacterium]|nr:hypothetical protein [Myxococcales bacterium]